MDVLIVAAGPDADVARALARVAGDVRVIAADGGASHCERAGLEPHLIVGDMDSISPATLERFTASGVAASVHPRDKDETDLDLALDEACTRGPVDRLVLTGVTGGRADHALAALGTLARFAACRPIVIERDLDAWILDAAGRRSVEIDRPGATVSVISLGGDAIVSGRGLRYPLDNLRLRPLDSRGLSNVVDHPPALVEVESGTILVMAPTSTDTQ